MFKINILSCNKKATENRDRLDEVIKSKMKIEILLLLLLLPWAIGEII